MTRSKIGRREFVTGTIAAAVAATAVGKPSASPTTTAPQTAASQGHGMRMATLPRPGRYVKEVPVYGCGCATLQGMVVKDRKPEEAVRIFRYAYDMGVRYFDSAEMYGCDPQVAEALRDVRDTVYIGSKTGAAVAAFAGQDGVKFARAHIERVLRRYGIDCVDCFKIHGPIDYETCMPVLDEIEKMKQESKVVNVGMSQHIHFELAYKLIDTGRLDEVLLAKAYFPKCAGAEIVSQCNWEFREMAIARAAELGMNIIGMKSLAAGMLGDTAARYAPDYGEEKVQALTRAAIRWALSDPRFHVYAIGVRRISDIDQNVATCTGDMTLTNSDRMLLAEFSTKTWGLDSTKKLPEPLKYPDSPEYVEPVAESVLRVYRQGKTSLWGED